MATRIREQQNRAGAQAANSQRRQKRRRGKRTLHYMLLILFLLAAGAVLSLTVFFKIETVTAVGTDKYAPDEIAASSGIVAGQNMLRINKAEVQNALMEKYPYIQSVEVKRKLPPGILLEITQAVPEAAIRQGDHVLLISREGKVLERGVLLAPEDLPLVKGIDVGIVQPGQILGEVAQERLNMLRDLLEAMEESEFKAITNVDLSDRLNMRVVYENRITLELGSEAELVHKLMMVKQVLENKLAPDATGILYANEPEKSRVRFRPNDGQEQQLETAKPDKSGQYEAENSGDESI